MPHAFVQLHPELEAAIDRCVVLTTTERLRRNLIRAFNDAQQARGRQAWPTPRVQTIGGYLVLRHRALRQDDPTVPQLLGAEAEYEVFRATAPAGAADLIVLAQQAWSMCWQWGIAVSPGAFSVTENGRTFAEWCERISRRLAAMNAVTLVQLPAVAGLRTAEAELACFAFEQLPTSLGRWLDAQTHCRITHLPVSPSPWRTSTGQRTSFDSRAEELAVVAQWARRHLESRRDDLRIGIVVPDLTGRQVEILRQFTAELDPLLETGTQGLVDIAGGVPLREQPIWLPARDWLSLCFDRLTSAQTRICLNSPFLDLPALPALPAKLPPMLDLPLLTRQLDLPGLGDQIQLLVRAERAQRKSLGAWLTLFLSILELAGWSGRQAGSVQYQAWQELRSRMDILSRWTDARLMDGPEALRHLDRFLSSITFAPERAPAPIQIMGYLETTGLDFTHLWVMGLDDQTWPQLPAQNPFLPTRLRLQHGVPRTTPADEAGFARDRLDHWFRCADTLIVSHVRNSGESELRPSPLIRQLPETELIDFQPDRPHPGFTHRPGQLESWADVRGPSLLPGTHRGGTGRIRDQALCPFRGFAIHRLGLKELRQPSGLPDALDRGVLIHEALHRLYENAGNDRLPRAELTDVHFTQAADQALALHYSRFPPAFRVRERERLVALLSAWNRFESTREDVAIAALELGLQAEFGGIGLNLRIDRMDRVNRSDDALIVIDYKTGRIGHRLTQDRLLDPQLPLYALTNEAVQGVLYAEVNEQRPRLRGISAVELEAVTLDEPAGGSWTTQRQRWQQQTDTLTEEITSGYAAVLPFDSRVCQTCHLHGLCRIALSDPPDDPGDAVSLPDGSNGP